MKGLLLKDWYQVRTSMKTHVPVGCICAGDLDVQTSNAYVFPVSYAARFSGHLADKPACLRPERWLGGVWPDVPVSKKTLVTEKYLIGLFCAAAAVVIQQLEALAAQFSVQAHIGNGADRRQREKHNGQDQPERAACPLHGQGALRRQRRLAANP
mgnify:CR=1 FL=1